MAPQPRWGPVADVGMAAKGEAHGASVTRWKKSESPWILLVQQPTNQPTNQPTTTTSNNHNNNNNNHNNHNNLQVYCTFHCIIVSTDLWIIIWFTKTWKGIYIIPPMHDDLTHI